MAADGSWSIDDLAPAIHTFRLAPATGAACATPAACAVTRTLTSGDTQSEIDFAAYRTASISGTVSDPDGPLSDRTVYLDSDDDGTLDDGEPTTTTLDDGTYTFTDLTPGSYRVRLDLPANEVCSAPADCVHTLALSSGEQPAGSRLLRLRATTLRGSLFEDLDGDGTIDATESGRRRIDRLPRPRPRRHPRRRRALHDDRHRRRVRLHRPHAGHLHRRAGPRRRLDLLGAGGLPAHPHARLRRIGDRTGLRGVAQRPDRRPRLQGRRLRRLGARGRRCSIANVSVYLDLDGERHPRCR